MMIDNMNISPEGLIFAPDEVASAGKKCGCKSGGGKSGKCASCGKRATKLDVYNWLSDIPEAGDETKMVEVQFKNTRKGYYLNSNNLELFQGDMVAVEASPGHDIGYVTLTGKLVQIQMKKNNVRIPQGEYKRVYRLARQSDIERYEQAKALEQDTMIRSRQIAESLNLDMKIGDVEYQGDGNKAIFYYIADGRVDFRQLIKVLAEEFRVRIEMKQIGARQEAGRIGGIGSCGRELCCASWNTNFVSVATSAARFQDISLNPQKLAGQCGKLKCCLNYEIDQYVEAYKQMPPRDAVLETKDGTYYHFKSDVFAGQVTYSTSKHLAANLVTLSKEQVFDVIRMNRAGEKPEKLGDVAPSGQKRVYNDILEEESITRFDNKKKKRNDRKVSTESDEIDNEQPTSTPSAEGGHRNRNAKRGRNHQRPVRHNALRNEAAERADQNPAGSSNSVQPPTAERAENSEGKKYFRRHHNGKRPNNGNRRNFQKQNRDNGAD